MFLCNTRVENFVFTNFDHDDDTEVGEIVLAVRHTEKERQTENAFGSPAYFVPCNKQCFSKTIQVVGSRKMHLHLSELCT